MRFKLIFSILLLFVTCCHCKAQEAFILKVPLIGQRDVNWCYAAAAEMVLKYYGKPKPRGFWTWQGQIVREIRSDKFKDGLPEVEVPNWISFMENQGLKVEVISPTRFPPDSSLYKKIYTSLKNDNPIIVFGRMSENALHAFVIKGLFEIDSECDNVFLTINDTAGLKKGCEVNLVYNTVENKLATDRAKYSLTGSDSIKLFFLSKQ